MPNLRVGLMVGYTLSTNPLYWNLEKNNDPYDHCKSSTYEIHQEN